MCAECKEHNPEKFKKDEKKATAFEELVQFADVLDKEGLKEEADKIDEVIFGVMASNLYVDAKKKKCQHMNADGTFKGGFNGCVSHMKASCGGNKSEESAKKICAYINRRKNGSMGETRVQTAEVINLGGNKDLSWWRGRAIEMATAIRDMDSVRVIDGPVKEVLDQVRTEEGI